MKLPEIEKVSAAVHEAWMQSKRSSGINSRKSETEEELMVSYEKLSEQAKDLDRNTVKAVYEAIEKLTLRKPHRYERMVTDRFYEKNVLCPRCHEENRELGQELYSTGDYEHLIFCPHCDLNFELKLITE